MIQPCSKYAPIPMCDLQLSHDYLKAEINHAIMQVVRSGNYIQGKQCRLFEIEMEKYLDIKHAIGVGSGTDALFLSLLAAGVGPGDEVITTSFSFIAAAEAIVRVGATPIFIDIEPLTLNINASLIERKITQYTKAILPVHIFGKSASMVAISNICLDHNLLMIEDCAQALGGRDEQNMLGRGDFNCYSFYPSKNLGCFGDGGMVTTNNDKSAERIRILKNHGSYQKNYHFDIGINSRLDEIQAAILRVKLNYLDQFNGLRSMVALAYNDMLKGVIKPINQDHVYNQYTILSNKRDDIKKALSYNNIASAIHYPIPLHKQLVFNSKEKLPVVEQIVNEVLSLPIYPELSLDKIETICNIINEEVV